MPSATFRFLVFRWRPIAAVLLFAMVFGRPVAADSPDQASTQEQTWQIFAGTGKAQGDSADQPSSPKSVCLPNVYGVEVAADAIYLSTIDDHSIWKMDLAGTKIERFAGTGQAGLSGDGGPALQARFRAPHEIRADRNGDLYVADTRNHCIRKIDGRTGIIQTIGGDGVAGSRGDGGPASQARFDQPHSIVLDGQGGLLVADTKNHRLRRIDLKTGTVATVAGDGKGKLPVDGALANEVSVFGPRSLAIDAESIWLVLREGNSVWRIDRSAGTIHRVAGTGKQGHSGDGGHPLQATFRGPKGIAVDSQGALLVVDTENQALRRVDRRKNVIETLDTGFQLKRPHGTAVRRGTDADVYFLADSENHRLLAAERKHREGDRADQPN
ncbi:NHL domain-containing protein [Roseiconus nitratireducens]|uniref:NHL domain-containing protein n=1 Tax=Roseiconus nitratireducens TaxID=2605748 RepID=UPI0013761A03|nr:hypothetical protein [Roseiconus nitratireducens]